MTTLLPSKFPISVTFSMAARRAGGVRGARVHDARRGGGEDDAQEVRRRDEEADALLCDVTGGAARDREAAARRLPRRALPARRAAPVKSSRRCQSSGREPRPRA